MPRKEEIIKRLIANTAEIITEDEFKQRLESGDQLTHYIGFEISGYVHIGQGIMSALVMKDLTDLGVKCTVWLADWHTWINEKLDGTLETVQTVGVPYFREAIIATFKAVGGDPAQLDIKVASEYYEEKGWSEYWRIVISVGQYTTTSRTLRSIDVMGREQGTDIELSKLLYPAMQAADVFFLGANIAHAGMDQRKAHVIMRDVAPKLGKEKAVAIHHPILMSLRGQSQGEKMSKSVEGSAIFIHDSEEEIASKINQAYCPEKEVENNPVLAWTKHLLFWNRQEPFRIQRKKEHGGDVELVTYQELEAAYAAGDIHPMDLKVAVAKEIIELLQPVREHFARPEIAAKKAELDKVLQSK